MLGSVVPWAVLCINISPIKKQEFREEKKHFLDTHTQEQPAEIHLFMEWRHKNCWFKSTTLACCKAELEITLSRTQMYQKASICSRKSQGTQLVVLAMPGIVVEWEALDGPGCGSVHCGRRGGGAE